MKAMKVTLLTILCALQFKLWLADGSITHSMHLRDQLQAVQQHNTKLSTYNQSLVAQIHELKQGTQALEAVARNDLGMIRHNEVFYELH